MCIKLSKNEIDYAKRMSKEDRVREIKRQRAFRDVRAEALLFRALPTEAKHSYQNAEGYRVTSNSLPLSLC